MKYRITVKFTATEDIDAENIELAKEQAEKIANEIINESKAINLSQDSVRVGKLPGEEK